MKSQDEITVAMLSNLIANIVKGNITTIDRKGEEVTDDIGKLTLIFHGNPDETL